MHRETTETTELLQENEFAQVVSRRVNPKDSKTFQSSGATVHLGQTETWKVESVSKEGSSGMDLHQDRADSSYVMCPPGFQNNQWLTDSKSAGICGYKASAICKEWNNRVDR